MAVKYVLKQLVRKFSDGRRDSANGKWYARAVCDGTLGTAELANIIQRNCSMKKSDVVAVLTELSEVMTDALQNSMAVKLDNFGIFKVGIQSRGALEPEGFSVSKHIKGTKVNFLPAARIDSATHHRSRALLDGIKFQETAKNAVGVVTE